MHRVVHDPGLYHLNLMSQATSNNKYVQLTIILLGASVSIVTR